MIVCIFFQGQRFWSVLENDNFTIKAAALKHRIPSFGYVVQEKNQVGTLDVQKLKKLGIPPGPDYGKLKEGKSVIVPATGREVKREQVVGPPKKGRKVVILGDTNDTFELKHLSMDADLVVHEATMENSMREKAIEFGHSTPSMASNFAIEVRAKKLILTHVSPRYKPIEEARISNAKKGKKDEKDDSALVLLNEAKDHVAAANSSRCVVAIAEDFFEDIIERPE